MTMQQASPPPAARTQPRRSPVAVFSVAALLTAALFLGNVVGQPRIEASISEASVKGTRDRFVAAIPYTQAGWPWTWLTLEGEARWPLSELDAGTGRIAWTMLAANAVVAVAIGSMGTLFFSHWWGRHRGWFQFGLLDLGIAMTLAALGVGYGLMPRMEYSRDKAVLDAMTERRTLQSDKRTILYTQRVYRTVWQVGRTDWLNHVMGEGRLPRTGHVIGIEVDGRHLVHVARLPRLQVLQVRGRATDADLNKLAALPELEYLDLADARLRIDRGGWLDPATHRDEFPLRLPQLKRLHAPGSVLQIADLTGMASLEELDMSRTVIDAASEQTIGQLASLRVLRLSKTRLSDAGLAEITKLQSLEVLDISETKVTDAGMQHLAGLPKLETLWLSNTAITDAGIASLAACPRLGSLQLSGTKVTTQGLADLRDARRELLASR